MFGSPKTLTFHYVTLQADGWTGLNHHHLIAFMVTVEKKAYTVKVHDASGQRKTAEALLAELESVITTLKSSWDVNVIALVTDASGESRKARRLFAQKYPNIIVLDCYSHQINLVVADLFKSKSNLLTYSEMASELITWLRSKAYILHHLPYAVLRAILTRWTAHYSAYRRLQDLSHVLIQIADNDLRNSDEKTRIMITGDKSSQEKAQRMVSIIKNSAFWHNLSLLTRYLEPLAIAANIVQGTFCRLDQVLLTFGYLVMLYSHPSMADDTEAQNAILKSLELRWYKADQELFIAAVLVNPFYRTEPFAKIPQFTHASIRSLFIRIWMRLNNSSTPPPPEFTDQASDFLDGVGIFGDLNDTVNHELDKAKRQSCQPDPLHVLRLVTHAGAPSLIFVVFASQLLSVSANSASCERLFSVFGNILTKLRSRLSNSTLVNLSELKMHVRDNYIRSEGKPRLQRRFQATQKQKDEGDSQFDLETQAGQLAAESSNVGASNTISPSVGVSFVPVFAPTLTTSTFGLSRSVQPEAGPLETPIQPSRASSFRNIIEQHSQLLEEDNLDNEPVRHSSRFSQMALTTLFDFSSTHWTDRFNHFAHLSFQEELALYDLLELDADGEEDLEFDSTTEDILLS